MTGTDFADTQPSPGRTASTRRSTLFWVALAIAVSLMAWVPIAGPILRALVPPAILGRMGPTLAILGPLLAIGVLTTLAYLALRLLRAETWLRVPRWALLLVITGDLLSLMPSLAAAFAVRVPGGGALFVVAHFGRYVIWAARACFAVAALLMFLASFRVPRAARPPRTALAAADAALVLAVLAVPTLYAGSLAIDHESPIQQGLRAKTLLQQRCREAGEWVLRPPAAEVQSLHMERDAGVSYLKIRDDGSYNSRSGGMLGGPLVNSGRLLFFEKDTDSGRHGKLAAGRYTRHRVNDWAGEPVDALESEYRLSWVSLSSAEEKSLGIEVSEMTVHHIASGDVLARLRYVDDRRAFRFCGPVRDGEFSTSAFVTRSLQLTKRFPSASNKPAVSPVR